MELDGKVKSKMLESLKKFSEKYQQSVTDVQVAFKLKPVNENEEGFVQCYQSLINYEVKEPDISIGELLWVKEMLGIALDPLKLREIVPTYIIAILDKIIDTENIDSENICIVVSHNGKSDKEEGILMHLYDGEEYKRKVQVSELTDQNNVMRLMQKYNLK